MVRQKGTVESVTLIRKIYTDLDQCEVRIGFDTYTAFYSFAELQELQGKDVSYVLRKDIVNGLEVLVITEITLLAAVNVVERTENVKLCPLNDARGVCNFDAASAQIGSMYPGSIVMVTDFQFKSSKRAKWVDFTCIDRKSKVMYLRLFDATLDAKEAENEFSSYVGKYIKADIKYTNFGFQTEKTTVLEIATSISPSVALAKAIVEEEIKKDVELQALCDKLQYINKLEVLVTPEPGWSLVKIATRLNLIYNIENLISGADIEIMKKAAILSQLHLLPTKFKYTDDVKSVLLLKQSQALGADNKLLNLVTGGPIEDETDATYKLVSETADKLNEIRYMYGG